MGIVDTAWDIVFCVLLVLAVIAVALTRFAWISPRFRRWLDAKLYRAFPRLGHLLSDDSLSDADR